MAKDINYEANRCPMCDETESDPLSLGCNCGYTNRPDHVAKYPIPRNIGEVARLCVLLGMNNDEVVVAVLKLFPDSAISKTQASFYRGRLHTEGWINVPSVGAVNRSRRTGVPLQTPHHPVFSV